MVEIQWHSQTKGRVNSEHKHQPTPARQSSTLPMSGMWKRSYATATWAPPDERAATDKPNLRPPRHISTLAASVGRTRDLHAQTKTPPKVKGNPIAIRLKLPPSTAATRCRLGRRRVRLTPRAVWGRRCFHPPMRQRGHLHLN